MGLCNPQVTDRTGVSYYASGSPLLHPCMHYTQNSSWAMPFRHYGRPLKRRMDVILWRGWSLPPLSAQVGRPPITWSNLNVMTSTKIDTIKWDVKSLPFITRPARISIHFASLPLSPQAENYKIRITEAGPQLQIPLPTHLPALVLLGRGPHMAGSIPTCHPGAPAGLSSRQKAAPW